MIEICINEKESFSMPENWAEVFKKDKYLSVIKVLYAEHENAEILRLSLLSALSDWDGFQIGKAFNAWHKKSRSNKADKANLFSLAMQVKEQLLPTVEFIFEDLFVECPIEVINIGNLSLHAPAIRLFNQTGIEMSMSHHAMVNFANDQKEIHLDRLIAINYHPATDGIRNKFDDKDFEHSIAAIAKLPMEQKLGIYHWFCKCEEWWHRKYAYMYSEDEVKKAPDLHENGNLWRKILLKIADNKMGQDYDAVMKRSREDIYFLLDHLEDVRLDMEALTK